MLLLGECLCGCCVAVQLLVPREEPHLSSFFFLLNIWGFF